MAQSPGERFKHRNPGKTPSRTAAFREIARGIVAKDRYDRRAGFSVDTAAGAIARALERAYAQGFADAQAPLPLPSAPLPQEDTSGPVEWVLIPPRPRDAFWTICLFTLGRDPAVTPDGTGRLDPTPLPDGRPGWRLVTDRYDKPFGFATLRPLVRLGLLGPVHAPEPYSVVSARGQATWWRFVERGGQYPEDLTEPDR